MAHDRDAMVSFVRTSPFFSLDRSDAFPLSSSVHGWQVSALVVLYIYRYILVSSIVLLPRTFTSLSCRSDAPLCFSSLQRRRAVSLFLPQFCNSYHLASGIAIYSCVLVLFLFGSCFLSSLSTTPCAKSHPLISFSLLRLHPPFFQLPLGYLGFNYWSLDLSIYPFLSAWVRMEIEVSKRDRAASRFFSVSTLGAH